jgi:hypothetical protein
MLCNVRLDHKPVSCLNIDNSICISLTGLAHMKMENTAMDKTVRRTEP